MLIDNNLTFSMPSLFQQNDNNTFNTNLIATTTTRNMINYDKYNLSNINNNIIKLYDDNNSSWQSNNLTKDYFNLTINLIQFNNININNNNNNYDMEYMPCDPKSGDKFNCSVNEFLLFALGPQTLPLVTALLVTIFFVGIFITGIIGNVIICVVIVKQSALHTATNYYLFSLAVSDLIYLLGGLPYEISLYWHQYPYNMGLPFCKIRAFISEATSYVSVLTIVAFSMERFLAICHPLHLYTMSGFKRAVRIIAALWIISFLSAVPFALYTKINYIAYPPNATIIEESAFCAMLENPSGFPLWELSFLLFFVIPMILIMILYGRMGYQIRSRTQRTGELGVTHGSMHKDSKHQSKKAIIRMLAAVVITFFVCWTPFHIQRLAFIYAREWQYFTELNTWLFSIGGWCYYVSCTINPILYNVMSHRYRVAFKETLCGKRRSYYNNANGFARDQSSFRETMKTTASISESSHLIRVKSLRNSNYVDRNSIKSNNLWKAKRASENMNKQDEDKKTLNNSSSVIVVDNNLHGRPKVLTTTDVHENLQKKNETYI